MEDLSPNTARAFSVDSKTTSVKSPRMKRLASQLAIIHISLDPPSPPPSKPDYTDSELSIDYGENYVPPFYWQYDCSHRINNSHLLQVPGSNDLLDDGMPRQHSPPPRRCSYASTTSENSSISLNASYQNLLSPFMYNLRITPNNVIDRQTSHSITSDDSETPPPMLGFQRNSSSNIRNFDISGNTTPNIYMCPFSAMVCFVFYT